MANSTLKAFSVLIFYLIMPVKNFEFKERNTGAEITPYIKNADRSLSDYTAEDVKAIFEPVPISNNFSRISAYRVDAQDEMQGKSTNTSIQSEVHSKNPSSAITERRNSKLSARHSTRRYDVDVDDTKDKSSVSPMEAPQTNGKFQTIIKAEHSLLYDYIAVYILGIISLGGFTTFAFIKLRKRDIHS